MPRPINHELILSATETGAGPQQNTLGHYICSFVIISSGVSTGATIKIQGSPDGGNTWIDIASDVVISSSGTNEVHIVDEYWELVRANCSAYSDGTHLIYLAATGFVGPA
jgi:hypothetical protein